MADQFGGWKSNFLLESDPAIETPDADLGGWGSNFLLSDNVAATPVPHVGTPRIDAVGPPPPISVPFVNQPTNKDPLTALMDGSPRDPDWDVPAMDPASTFQPRTDALTFDGQPFPRHYDPGDAVYRSSANERARLQQNKDSSFPYSSDDWGYYGGSLRPGVEYQPPTYDGTVPLARLMKPLANNSLRGIRQAREFSDEEIMKGLMGAGVEDLKPLGMDDEFRDKLQVYRNYQGDADRRGNKESAKIAAKYRKELVGKAREIWNKALDNQERLEHLKQAWREELDKGEGETARIKDSAVERVSGQALFDTGTLAASIFYRTTGQEAKSDDLNLAKLAYDAVVNEYAGDSKGEAAARGVGSSLFQAVLFSRLGSAVAGTGASGAGSQVASAVAFGASARNQAMAESSMKPMTDRSRKAYAGRQAAIETGVTGLFGLVAHAVGAKTFEQLMGGKQPFQSIRNGLKTVLTELPEEMSITGLQQFNSKLAGITPEDAELLPELFSTAIQTALTLGFGAGARGATAFVSSRMPSRQQAIAAGVDAIAKTAPARQQLAEKIRQSEAAMRAQLDKVGEAGGNLWDMAENAIRQRMQPAQSPPQQQQQSTPPAASPAPPQPSPLDDLAARYPEVAEAFAGPTGTPEFASIREHTAVVLDRYQKSGASTGVPELDAVMPTIIALHDIGKPAAIAAGDKNRQHEMTLPILMDVMTKEGASRQQVEFAGALVGQDIIGQLMRGQISVQAASTAVEKLSGIAGLSPQQFLPVMQSLYSADAGSYAGLSKLFDAQGRIPNYDLRALEESIHGQVQSIPWTESYRGGGQQPASAGDVQRTIYSHSSAVDFTRFDAAKDSGTNLAGPGAYLLPAGNDAVAKIYQDRAIAKGLKALGRNDRQRIMQAIAKKDVASFDKWIDYARQKQATDPARANDWGQVADVLAAVRDNGVKGFTLEFEFEPKKMLDLGAMRSGGRMLTDEEIGRLMKAGSSFFKSAKYTGSKRAWTVFESMQKTLGYAKTNEIIRKAGYDSIGFIHTGHASNGSLRHPVVVALDYNAPVRVQSGAGLTTDAANKTQQAASGIPIDRDTMSKIRRLFLSGGNQDPLTRTLVFRRDSIIRKHNAKVQQATRDLKRAVSKSGQQISEEALNEALADPAKIAQLPTEVAVEVMKIRDHIDMMSDQIQMLGGVTPEMFLVIEGNKGSYITRTFKKFDDPVGWMKKALNDPQIMADFAAEVRQPSPQATDQEIRSLAEELLRRNTLSPGAMIASGSTTQNYVNILKKRKNLSPAVLALYGEKKNIFENYATTIGQMSSMVAHRGFIENLANDGLATGLFSRQGGPRAQPTHTAEVSHQMIPQLAGMKGILMEPELAQAIDDLYAQPNIGRIGKLFATASGMVKAAKTVGAFPRADIRNLIGNLPITMANGNWFQLRSIADFGSAAKATLMDDLLNQSSPQAKAAMERMKELGVVESFRMEELKDAARHSAQITKSFLDGVTSTSLPKRTFNAASRIYGAMDTVSKIHNYMAELRTLQRAYPNAPLASLEEKAARITRALNPTYAEASAAAKWWSRHAPLGSFAMFSAEMIRTQGNRMAQMAEEIRSGNPVLVGQGLKRFLGQGFALAGLGALRDMLAWWWGTELTEEQDKAMRERLPDYQKHSMILVTEKDASGNPTSYVDFGYNDPFGIFTKTARAAAYGNAEDVTMQALEPFISEDILAGSLLSIWRGRDENDVPIYDKGLSEAEQNRQIMQFAIKKLEPGIITSAKRIGAAARGETTKSGLPLDLANEIASNLGGMRVETFSRDVSDYYRNRDYDDRVKASQTTIRRLFLNKGTFNEAEVRRQYADAEATRRQNMVDWRKYVEDGKLLGEENPYGKVVRDVGQESMIIQQMYSGTYTPYVFQDADFAKMMQLPQGEQRIKLFQELYRQGIGLE